MKEEIRKGYIFYADLGEKIGSEQKGERPVVIIQNNVGNEFSPTVIIVPITSKINEKAKIPTHIFINKKKYGLTYDSMILAEQTTTIDKKRLGNYIGTLTEEEMLQLDFALINAFGLDIEKMMNKRKNKNSENIVETLTRKKSEFTINEAVAYYIVGFQNAEREIKEKNNKNWVIILKQIIESVRDYELKDIQKVITQNKDLLKTIKFKWFLSPDDFVSYATCIFYVLTNREEQITNKKIVTEFISEMYIHHPRKTLKEANFILDQAFPKYE